jgi:hypothetical protein
MEQNIKTIGVILGICQTIYLVPTSPFSISHHCHSIPVLAHALIRFKPPASLSIQKR